MKREFKNAIGLIVSVALACFGFIWLSTPLRHPLPWKDVIALSMVLGGIASCIIGTSTLMVELGYKW